MSSSSLVYLSAFRPFYLPEEGMTQKERCVRLDTQIRVLMRGQVGVDLVDEQDGGSARTAAGSHVVDAVAHLCHLISSASGERIQVRRRTIMSPLPRFSSSIPHERAICNMPAGSGFGGRNSRVMIGWKVLPSRNVVRRWLTGVLDKTSHQPSLGCWKRVRNLTQSSVCRYPCVRLVPRGIPSAPLSLAAVSAFSSPRVQLNGWPPWLALAQQRGESRYAQGCRSCGR